MWIRGAAKKERNDRGLQEGLVSSHADLSWFGGEGAASGRFFPSLPPIYPLVCVRVSELVR